MNLRNIKANFTIKESVFISILIFTDYFEVLLQVYFVIFFKLLLLYLTLFYFIIILYF